MRRIDGADIFAAFLIILLFASVFIGALAGPVFGNWVLSYIGFGIFGLMFLAGVFLGPIIY